uniref:Pollen-specific protein C13 n=1 Tax=Zea mays TaxID=4577 RepID=A0A804MGZ0_MAIZE
MASIPATTFAVILSVLFCAAAGTAVDNDLPDYVIQGRVYCDTCRAGFVTNVTEYICEVVLVESPRKDCDQVQADRDRAGVLLTRNVGISDNLRPANPLGYLKDVPLPICASLLKQLDSDDDDDQ